MTCTRLSLASLVATVGILSFAAVGCSGDADSEDTGEASEAITDGRVIVRQAGSSSGPAVTRWGYDIKQQGRSRALKPALAQEIFAEIGMNLLRIPVRAAEAHPSRGVSNIKGGAYADDLDAIKNVKAVKPSVDVFASLRLDGPGSKKSFPGWVKDGGEVEAGKYAELLEDYLAYFKQNGVTIDWLGVDNESRFNEGNITPAKYNTIVSNVKDWCRGHDVKVPGFIAPENYGPTEDLPWLENLWQSPSKFGHLDHVGVHIYSKHRESAYVDAMQRLANNTHGAGLWDTELHWNDLGDDGDVRFDDIKTGLLSAMDHFDLGFHTISWWAFQPRSAKTKAAHVMSELVSSTLGAGALPTDDMDGRPVAIGKFNSRAFANGGHRVTVWVANFESKDRKDQVTEISNQSVTAASYVQWSPSGPDAGKTGSAAIVSKSHAFSMNFPSDTITRVTVTLK